MATLYVGEYNDIGSTSRGSIAIPLEPPQAEQAVDIGPVSKQSDALSGSTTIVKLVADADCAISIGLDPDATNSVRHLAAGKEQIITVLPNAKLKIAVVASGSGSMSDSLGAFLKVIANPADAKKQLDGLTQRASDIDASAQALRTATDANKKAKADADDAAAKAADAQAKAKAAQDSLAQREAALAAAKATQEDNAKAQAAADAARNDDLDRREANLKSLSADVSARANAVGLNGTKLDAREADLKDREANVAALEADYAARIAKLKALTA